ncbi:zinc finger BED domain-containing protein 5 [Trichonephila clavipes]|nr:zinc finger BED domain-containing protein 5 [Trichonephila clavipes]
MMEAEWSARRVTRQLGRSDCVPTASSAAIQAQVTPSLGAPVSSRTIRRCLAEGHLGSLSPLRVLPLTPTHRCLCLEWCRARGNWTAAEWNHVVFSDQSRFNLSSGDNRVRVWRPHGERLNPAFALQRHTAPAAGVIAWGAITNNSRSPLVLIRGTMTAQRYVHDILQPHVLHSCNGSQEPFFNKTMLGLNTARVSQDCFRTVIILPWSTRFPNLSPIEHIWDHLGRRVGHPTIRCKKPHTIAEELILPAAIEIVETMFGDNFAKELQSISLSNDTVSRQIDDIAEDVEQQLFGKLRDKLFSIQLDEATDSNKDAHFIAYVRFWDASYEWVRDPFQNTPEGLSTTEEEIFIDFTSSGEIKRQFCNKTHFQFWAEVDDEFSELKTKAFRILLPFSTWYLCETGFSAVAALKTKYRSQLNIEKELRVSISNIKPSFENLCSARQAHGSH